MSWKVTLIKCAVGALLAAGAILIERASSLGVWWVPIALVIWEVIRDAVKPWAPTTPSRY